jgi:hypothetical protein
MKLSHLRTTIEKTEEERINFQNKRVWEEGATVAASPLTFFSWQLRRQAGPAAFYHGNLQTFSGKAH